MEPGPPALGVWSHSHWTTREVPVICLSHKHDYIGGSCDSSYIIKLGGGIGTPPWQGGIRPMGPDSLKDGGSIVWGKEGWSDKECPS